MASYRLLDEFRKTFEGKKYRHRDSSLGDWVALHLYEDLYDLGRSKHFVVGAKSREKVLNVQNKRRGIKARRGDGTFGELIPGMPSVVDLGFSVARGPIANVEVGAEAKFLSKAMIKQVGRVKTDLKNQVASFQRGAGNPICVAIIGVNWADYTIGYEGDRVWRTNGKNHKHPIQEAAEVEERIQAEIAPKFDELIVLRYRAPNDPDTEPPYQFSWVSFIDTFQDYGAALVRLSREYDTRFG